jgi:hypothetical protein
MKPIFKTMRSIVIMSLFVLCSTLGWSQEVSSAVKSAMKPTELKGLSSDEVLWLNFLAENMAVIQMAPEKSAGLVDFSTISRKDGSLNDVTAIDVATFNPLQYNLEILPATNQYFRLGDTGQVMMIYSKERLDVLFARYKKNLTSK